jgi:hypothetical protein
MHTQLTVICASARIDNCTYVPVVDGNDCPTPNLGAWPGGCSSLTEMKAVGNPTSCLGGQFFWSEPPSELTTLPPVRRPPNTPPPCPRPFSPPDYTHPGAVDNLIDSALTLMQAGGGGIIDGFFTDGEPGAGACAGAESEDDPRTDLARPFTPAADFDGFPSEHYW